MPGDLTIKAYGVVVDLVMDGEPFGTVVGSTKEEALSRAEEIKRRWDAYPDLIKQVEIAVRKAEGK